MNRNGWSEAQLMSTMAEAVACMTDDYHETQAALRKAGFNFLGCGAYGAAFTRPDIKGYAIKLSSGQGDTYPAYVYWAMANPMQCIPEFKYPVFSNDREMFMVMMPRLSECKEELAASKDYDIASEIIHGYDEHRDTKIVPNSPLQHAAKALREFFGHRVSWDFHRGNLMWDSLTQSYVITDPMCGGPRDEFISQITGKSPINHTIQEQLGFGFDNYSRNREWPRPEFADRVVPVEIGAGLERHAALERERLIQERNVGLMKFPKEFQAVPMMSWKAEPVQFRPQVQAFVPDAIGRAADWVRQQGIKPQRARQIGELAQDWNDQRLSAAGDFVMFNFAPSLLPQFVVKQTAFDPCAAVPVERIAVPKEVVRVLRDQWRIDQDNRGRRAWTGRVKLGAPNGFV